MGSLVEARAGNVWLRSEPFWDVYFGMVLAGTIVIAATNDNTPGAKAVGIGLLLALTLAYVTFGRVGMRAAVQPTVGSVCYVAAMLALFVPATILEQGTAFGLSAVVPQVFMALRRLPLVIPVLLAVASGPAFDLAVHDAMPLPVVLAVGVVVLSASALLGFFIDRTHTQNVKRAELIDELDRTRGELAETSKEAGMLAERARLAGDLHDTLAQGLASIGMFLQAAEAETGPNPHLALAQGAAREHLGETRALIAALTPPALRSATLTEALRQLAQDFRPPVEFTVSGEAAALSADAQMVLLRATQEGLANVRRHAHATSARLTLAYLPDGARLTLTDDGRGFRLGGASRSDGDGNGGYGLPGMRGRAARAGGAVRITSEPGRGTTIEVRVPCCES